MSSSSLQKFIRLTEHPFKFRMFLLTKLPSAYFSGVRVKTLSETTCEVTVPFTWFSRNPFHSTYFACLGMAAELSTGALAMAHTYQQQPSISMLVTTIEGHFHKKATRITIFTCEDGNQMGQVISAAKASGEPLTFRARSTGRNSQGELVSEFYITWSFKVRSTR